MTEEEWVIEALKFYRPMEFFAEFSQLSGEELAHQLIARRTKTGHQSYLEIWEEAKAQAAQEHEEWEVSQPEASADMVLLAYDEDRIWWDDGEVDIYPQGETYTNFIAACSRISRGAFNVENIEEEWEGQELEGVTFDFEGDKWRIYPNQAYGWIDFDILDQINQIIKESSYKFYMHETGDQTTFIVVLTETELQKLESGRHWCFWDDEAEE